MADIFVKDRSTNDVIRRLVSLHETTVRQLLEITGEGVLEKVDIGVTWANPNVILEAGTYYVDRARGRTSLDNIGELMKRNLLTWKAETDLFGLKRKQEGKTTTEAIGNNQKRWIGSDENSTKTADKKATSAQAKEEEPEETTIMVGGKGETTVTDNKEETVTDEEQILNNLKGEKVVEKIFPTANGCWYLGADNEPLYIRKCVRAVGGLVLEKILKKEQRANRVYVITGPSGICKSWSINAFMAELLANNLKVFFHSAYYERAWIFSNDGTVDYQDPANIMASMCMTNLEQRQEGKLHIYGSMG